MSELPGRYELLRSRVDRFTRMLHGVESGEVRAIHQTRVASRRLRELLPVLALDGDDVRKLARGLRRATRDLGAIREIDVLVLLIQELQDSGRHADGGLARLAADTRKAREKAREDLDARSVSAKLRRLGRRLERVAAEFDRARDGKSGARGWRWAIDARVARRAETLQRAIHDAGAMYIPERLHCVRIALKKLRYGLELVAEAGVGIKGSRDGDGRASDLVIFKRGQELLGRVHDLAMLIDRARGLQASLDAREVQVRRDLDALVVALEQSCRRLHGRYVRERTAISGVCDRLVARSERSVRQARARRAG